MFSDAVSIVTAHGSEGTIVFSVVAKFFLGSSVYTITHEPLHFAWWNFALRCSSTTSKTLSNFRVIGQGSRSHGIFERFLCAWYCLNQLAWIHKMLHKHDPPSVLSLEQRLTILLSFVIIHIIVLCLPLLVSCYKPHTNFGMQSKYLKAFSVQLELYNSFEMFTFFWARLISDAYAYCYYEVFAMALQVMSWVGWVSASGNVTTCFRSGTQTRNSTRNRPSCRKSKTSSPAFSSSLFSTPVNVVSAEIHPRLCHVLAAVTFLIIADVFTFLVM